MREIFLGNLPIKNTNRQTFDWEKCAGEKVKFIYDEIEGEVLLVSYKKKERSLYIKYNDEDIFKINTECFKKCMLGNLLGVISSKFKLNINQEIKDNKRNLIIIDKENRKNINDGINYKWYKYKCNVCGWKEGWIVESNLLKGIGCSCCRGLTVVEGINDIPTTAPWMVKFFQGGYDEAKLYTKSSNQKIYAICPDCNTIKNKGITIASLNTNHSIGCNCGDNVSYPNKLMYNLLSQVISDIDTEYSPEWCRYIINKKEKQGIYDFYFKLNSKEHIVEMDGSFHNNDNKMNGQTKEESKYIDDEKDRLAQELNIPVIRIDCSKSELGYIKDNILNSTLADILDLSNIDWDKCEEYALSNLCKLACEYKKNNKEITVKEISNIMGINRVTIRIYLQKGSMLDWCEYDSKKESFKGSSNSGKMNGKPVKIFKDDTYLGVFESGNELARQSEGLFGVKLFANGISRVCTNVLDLYKGYSFEYVG